MTLNVTFLGFISVWIINDPFEDDLCLAERVTKWNTADIVPNGLILSFKAFYINIYKLIYEFGMTKTIANS